MPVPKTALPELVIWGAAGHALVVADAVRLAGQYLVAGFLDDVSPERWGLPFSGATVLGGRGRLSELRATGVRHLVVAVGSIPVRRRLAAEAVAEGFELAVVVHPRALVAAGVSVGPGAVIAASAVIGPSAVIGANAIVNTGACVDHECDVGEGVHIGPGVTLGGRVKVGAGVWVGLGAAVRDRVVIGADAIIGMGSVVLADAPAGMVSYGAPARAIRPVEPNDHR